MLWIFYVVQEFILKIFLSNIGIFAFFYCVWFFLRIFFCILVYLHFFIVSLIYQTFMVFGWLGCVVLEGWLCKFCDICLSVCVNAMWTKWFINNWLILNLYKNSLYMYNNRRLFPYFGVFNETTNFSWTILMNLKLQLKC